jgi:hypothetical protein
MMTTSAGSTDLSLAYAYLRQRPRDEIAPTEG